MGYDTSFYPVKEPLGFPLEALSTALTMLRTEGVREFVRDKKTTLRIAITLLAYVEQTVPVDQNVIADAGPVAETLEQALLDCCVGGELKGAGDIPWMKLLRLALLLFQAFNASNGD